MVPRLPQREQQIATLVFARDEASAGEVRDALPDPLSDSAVRAMLRRLVAKGVLRKRKAGGKFLYRPATPPAGKPPGLY